MKNYLSKDNTDCLKGIFAIFIVVHHCRAQMSSLNNTVVGMILTALGYLSVAIFYFLSGYGLEKQYQVKGDDYIKKFPYNRIIPFYAICSCTILVYSIFKYLMGIPFSFQLFLQSFIFGKTIVSNGWYLQSIIFVYLLFYLDYRFFKERRLSVMIIFLIIYCGVVLILTKNIIYFESIFTFILGIAWAQYKEEINKMMNNKKIYILSFVVSVSLFCITLLIGNLRLFNSTIYIFSKMISAVIFVFCTVLMLMKINISNNITVWLGKIFCEIYIMQGIFLELFHSRVVYIKNEYMYLIIVIISTISVAYIVHPIFNLLSNNVKNILYTKFRLE
ncbi:acyltransferase family protein [Clostridium perfringens]|uniref:acyltransferase family protein n=2 Tax=Clostridium perfringens TaxID=1502 RepID=UPI0039EA2A01